MTLPIEEVDLSFLPFAEIELLPVVTPHTLPELFAAHGVTAFQVAQALGVELVLIQRVIAYRQPLAADLVVAIALFLNEPRGTIEACAGLITTSSAPISHVPLPPDPVLGDLFPAYPLAETAQTPLPTGGTPEIIVWVCGAALAADGIASGVIRIGRNTGLQYTHTDFVQVVTPVELVTDGSSVFTSGSAPNGGFYAVGTMNAATGARTGDVADPLYVVPLGMVWEPDSGTLWLCSSSNAVDGLVQVNPESGLAAGVVTLTDGVHNFKPRDVVALNGLLYVTGWRATGMGAGQEGRLFEVDPVGLAVLRVSTGANLHSAYGVATDGVNTFLVASADIPAGVGALINRVDRTTFIAALVTLSGDPETITDASWIEYLFGSWWVTDLTASGARIFQMTVGGPVLQSRSFGGTTPGGHCAADPWFLWYADKAHGEVHVLNPEDISASAVEIPVGGSPDGLLVRGG